jgi:hypothetical protein
MVNVDLSKNRWMDKVFPDDVEDYGLKQAMHLWEERDREEVFQGGVLEFWVGGMTYKAIGGLIGARPQEVSKMLKPLIAKYHARCHENLDKLNRAVLCAERDPDYVFMVDQRTVLQEMCALLIGGSEIKDILEQLSNLGESK